MVLADGGYGKEAELVKLENAEIDAFVAVGREGRNSKQSLARRRATKSMQVKLNTKRERARYRKRKHIVEPVFGRVKTCSASAASAPEDSPRSPSSGNSSVWHST